jgi:hypothetical protein
MPLLATGFFAGTYLLRGLSMEPRFVCFLAKNDNKSSSWPKTAANL